MFCSVRSLPSWWASRAAAVASQQLPWSWNRMQEASLHGGYYPQKRSLNRSTHLRCFARFFRCILWSRGTTQHSSTSSCFKPSWSLILSLVDPGRAHLSTIFDPAVSVVAAHVGALIVLVGSLIVLYPSPNEDQGVKTAVFNQRGQIKTHFQPVAVAVEQDDE